MIQDIDLIASVREASNSELIKEKIAALCSVTNSEITSLVLLKRSIDARSRTIKVNLRYRVYINEVAPEILLEFIQYKNVASAKPVLIIGAGPAGLFAALRLIEKGFKPILIERGKNVRGKTSRFSRFKSQTVG